MKVFVILSVILVGVLAEELIFERNSNEDLSSRRRFPARLRNSPAAWQSRSLGNSPSNNRLSGDSDDWESVNQAGQWNGGELSPEIWSSILQRQSSTHDSNVGGDSSLGYWSSYPDAAAFDAKIKARLGSSKALADKPQVRRKITELAEEKFNQCKGKVEDAERACLGRSTGQIMQLVAAVENMARNPQ